MRRVEDSRAEVDRGSGRSLHAEEMAAEHRAHHVHNRIHHADLMELHIRGTYSMGRALRPRQSVKDLPAPVFHPRRKLAGRDDPLDAAERDRRAESVPHHHLHLRGGEAAPHHCLAFQIIGVDGDGFEPVNQVLERQAGINQRAQDHIPAGTRETVKMKKGHHASARARTGAHVNPPLILTKRPGDRKQAASIR